MDPEELRELATAYLQPFFSGATIDVKPARSTAREHRVAFISPGEIQFKVDRSDLYRLRLRRSQRFQDVSGPQLTERTIVEAFVDVVEGMRAGLSTRYATELRDAIQRRVVARSLATSAVGEESIGTLIERLAHWGGQLYEGKPIAAALGVSPGTADGNVGLGDYCLEPFSAVLSNGHDSIVLLNRQLHVIGHEAVSVPPTAPAFAPLGVAFVAGCTTQLDIALVLNRLGELLVLRKGELLFVRRGGRWHYLPHLPVVEQMGQIGQRPVREAVYSTCLDTSFARSGGCIGIVASSKRADWRKVAVSSDDYLEAPQSVKARTLKAMIRDRPFQDLPRRLRQELVAIDGATVLSHEGQLLAVGAILKIDGGSSGGGRLAAAKALGSLGLGIKISQDGGIIGFPGAGPAARFRAM